MAKEKKGKKKKKDSAGPRDAVRGAVESTFQAAAGGASKAQEILDDVATTLKTLRDANLVETLESVRDEVQSLAKRVAALELRGTEAPKPAATRRPSTSTARKPAARKPAARKPASTAAKPASSSTSTAAKKPAARKPAARKPASTASKPASTASKPASTASKPATSRSTTAASKPAARRPAARKPAASRSTTTKPSS